MHSGGRDIPDRHLHIALTAVSVPLVLIAIGMAFRALGGRSRIYSIATVVVTLEFGALTGA